MTPEETYEQALEAYKAAFPAWDKARQDYRARKIDDAAFLAAKGEIDAYQAAVDAAEAALDQE